MRIDLCVQCHGATAVWVLREDVAAWIVLGWIVDASCVGAWQLDRGRNRLPGGQAAEE